MGLRTFLLKFRGCNRLLSLYDLIQTKIGGDVVLQASLNTSNIGDLAPALILERVFKDDFGLETDLIGLVGPDVPDFRNYKYHVICGGGVIRDYPKGYLAARLMPIDHVEKSFAIGVGVPGIITKKGRELVRKMNKMELITVRDEQSKERLEKYLDRPVHVTACPSFLLESEIREKTKRDSERIGLNLNPKPVLPKQIIPDREKIIRNYDNVLSRLRNLIKYSDDEFFFIPHSYHDLRIGKDLFGDLNIRIMPLQPPIKTLLTVSKMDKMITTRYHSLIFSIIAEKPVYAISYIDKVMNLAKELGSPKHYFDLHSSQNSDGIEFTPQEKVREIHKNMIIRAEKNIKLLREHLT